MRLQEGENIGMPDVRPMREIAPGVAEIRVSDNSGTFRTFHVVHSEYGILVFHAFMKKTRTTTQKEKKTAKKRLNQYLADLEGKK